MALKEAEPSYVESCKAMTALRSEGTRSEMSEKVLNERGTVRSMSRTYISLERWVLDNLEKRLVDVSSASPRHKAAAELSIGRVGNSPEGSTIWGAGLVGTSEELSALSSQKISVRSARGEWSRQAFRYAGHYAGLICGEPALLMATFFPEFKFLSARKSEEVVVAIQRGDGLGERQSASGIKVEVLNPDALPVEQIEYIIGAGLVVSSSVTVVAIAESYNVPARLIDPSNDNKFYFQHRDYLSGTGRPFELVARDISEAIKLGGHPRPIVDLEALYESFPFDLGGDNKWFPPAIEELKENFQIDGKELGNWIDEAFFSKSHAKQYRDQYTLLLEELISGEREMSRDQQFSLYAQRYWFAPGIDLSNKNRDVRALDYIVRNEPKNIVKYLSILKQGLSAVVYSQSIVNSGIIFGIVFSSPYILDLPVSLRLWELETGRETFFRIPHRTVRIGQSLIDVDVFLAGASKAESLNLGIELHFESGFTKNIDVEFGPAPWANGQYS